MARTVKRLMNLEIDEVSLVDTPANQHGLVAIAKSYQEDNMPVYDAEGQEVFEDELSPGDLVYDESGNEYRYVEGDEGDEDEGFDDGDDEEVGKSARSLARDVVAVPRAFARGRAGEGNVHSVRELKASRAGRKVRRTVGDYREGARDYANLNLRPRLAAASATASNVASNPRVYGRRAARAAGGHISDNRVAYGGGALAGAGGYTAGRRDRVRKSYGDEVLTELSKALTEDDRDQVIAKALGRFDEIAKRNEELEETVRGLVEDRELEGYSEVAKSYGLGSEADIAGLLHRASQVLPEEDLFLLDQVFSGAGEIAKAYFDEIGVVGGQPSTALDEIYAGATDAVIKNADSGMSEEQAVVAMLAANPAAYDEYEAEQRYLR